MNQEESVYMVHPRELIRLAENVYKLGRSHHVESRIRDYPKGSKIMCIMNCIDSIFCEKELIKIFKEKFIQRKDYGTEYFQGDKHLMIKEIFNFIDKQYALRNAAVVVGGVSDGVVASGVVSSGGSGVGEGVSGVVGSGGVVGSVGEGVVGGSAENVVAISGERNTNVNKVRICPKCNNIFQYPSLLKRHLNNSSRCSMSFEEIELFYNPKKIISCNKCKATFSRHSSLVRHNLTVVCS